MDWDANTKEKFGHMIGRMPVFVRGMAEQRVRGKAESLAAQAGRSEVTEKDLVDAFFAETPFGFQGMMKDDMEAVGIDYARYGHPQVPRPGQ
ncbi:MAG: PCP reductase family protein [Deltaproteobacteria bacterium]